MGQAHRFAERGHLPGVHAAGDGRPALCEVLAQEDGQEGRHQVIDTLHIPAGGVPAAPQRQRCHGFEGTEVRVSA